MTSLPPLVDTHAHLDDRRLKSVLPDVLARAREAGVVQIVAIATDARDSRSVVEMARTHQGLFAAVGMHPNDLVSSEPGDWEIIRELATQPGVVAIGETGLDRYWKKTPFEQQQASFAQHLDLAAELDLPIVIHARDSITDIIEQLQALNRPVRGVLHSFTGTADEARTLVDLGLHISFAGMLTFANKSLDPLREAARAVPLDRLLVETDAPYLSPEPFRGKQNEPARVLHTATKLAEIRGIPLEVLAQATTANARSLFGLGEELFPHEPCPRHVQ